MTTQKRRISNESIESAASEHLRKFQWPVERVVSAELLFRVSAKFISRLSHCPLSVGRCCVAMSIILPTIKAAQFKGDETIGQSLHLGRSRFGFGVQTALGFDLRVVVGRQVLKLATLLIRFLHVT